MKYLIFSKSIMLPLALFLASAASQAAPLASSLKIKEAIVPGEIIIRFKSGTPKSHSETFLNQLGKRGKLNFSPTRPLVSDVYKIELQNGLGVFHAVMKCKKDPNILWAQPNYRYYALGCPLPTDQYYSSPYNWPLQKINAPQAWQGIAWNTCPPGGSSVTVAVIDSGVTRSHPDLPTSLFVLGYNSFTGLVDPSQPGLGSTPVTTILPSDDDFGHGTWVSSLLWAQWQNTAQTEICNSSVSTTGNAGLAPGVSLMPVKVLDSTGAGSSDMIAAGIEYAINNGAKVLNLSLGGPSFDGLMEQAILAAMSDGCVVVASSGNSGTDIPLFFPAGFAQDPVSFPALISVGATDENDNVAYYSDSGAGLDIVAPGGSGTITGVFTDDIQHNVFGARLNCPVSAPLYFVQDPADANFCVDAGTSASAPYVSGTAALMFSLCPNLTNVQVTQAILNNTDLLAGQTGWTATQGYGRLDVYKAISSASSCMPVPTWTFVPTPTITPTISYAPICCYQSSVSWGGTGSGTGQLSEPWGIVAASNGNVYVVDQGNYRVQEFGPLGNYITQWGSAGNGNGQFRFPYGIAVNSSGSTIYVVDTDNYRIEIFDQNGTYLNQWGSYGLSNGQFVGPAGVAVDSTGYVYVVDWIRNNIQKFDSNGNFQYLWGGSGNGNGLFNEPYDVAVDSSGHIFVMDGGNSLVQKFDTSGRFILQWGGYGSGAGQFNGPYQLATDSTGNVYVTDDFNSRIQKFDNDGNFLCLFGTSTNPNGIALNSTGESLCR